MLHCKHIGYTFCNARLFLRNSSTFSSKFYRILSCCCEKVKFLKEIGYIKRQLDTESEIDYIYNIYIQRERVELRKAMKMLFNSWVALTYSGRCYTFVQYVVTFVQCRKQTLKLRENTIVLLRKSLTKHPPIFYLLNEWKVKIYFRECDITESFNICK